MAVLQHLETATRPADPCGSRPRRSDHLGFDRATIYRNLTELTEAKLAARVELGDHVWRFEAKRAGGGHKGDDHPHFVCTTCGEVSCLDDVQVAITPRPAGTAGGGNGGKKSACRRPDRLRSPKSCSRAAASSAIEGGLKDPQHGVLSSGVAEL